MGKHKNTRVLINGVGIDSLCLAIGLAQEEVPLTLIDQRENNASLFNDELLILYPALQNFLKKIDVWYAIQEHVQTISSVHFFTKTSEDYVHGLDFDHEVTSPVVIDIHVLFDALLDNLKEYNHTIQWNTTLIDFKHKGTHSLCTLEYQGNKELFEASYLITTKANDGVAQSLVTNDLSEKKPIHHWIAKIPYDIATIDNAKTETEKNTERERQEDREENREKTTTKDGGQQENMFLLGAICHKENINTLLSPQGMCELIHYKEYSYVHLTTLQYDATTSEHIMNEYAQESLAVFANRLGLPLTSADTSDLKRNHYQTVPSTRHTMNHFKAFFIGAAANTYSSLHHTVNQACADVENILRKILLLEEHQANKAMLSGYTQERQHSHKEDHTNDQHLVQKLLSPQKFKGFGSSMAHIIAKAKSGGQLLRSYYLGTFNQYPESDRCVEEYPSLLQMAPWHKHTDVTWVDGYKFFAGPKAGYQAPPGYLVFESNEPKQNRRELLTNNRHVLLVFDGIHSTLTDEIDTLVDTLQDKYDDFLDCYRITTSYDISKHDGNASVFGDADSLLHKTYNAYRSSLYLIRPDGVIGFRSIGLLQQKLDDYIKNLGIQGY